MRYDCIIGTMQGATEESIVHVSLETDEANGQVSLRRIGGVTGAECPSYLLAHPDGHLLYAVEEVHPEGSVVAYEIRKDAAPVLVKRIFSGGDGPCHITMDDEAHYLFVSNYVSGSVAVIRLDENGHPAELTDRVFHTGNGPDVIRQEHAHVHFSAFHEGRLFVCDLGEDRVYQYDFDKETGMLSTSRKPVLLPAGTGPRHLTFATRHPKMMYVVAELTGQLYVFEEEGDGTYREVQHLSLIKDCVCRDTLPVLDVRAFGAAIKYDEEKDTLRISVRGDDTIASFVLCPDGTADERVSASACGHIPRDIGIFGDYLVVCNQESNEIIVLRREENGVFADTGARMQIQHPTCVVAEKSERK